MRKSYFPDSISLFWVFDPIEHRETNIVQPYSSVEVFRLLFLGPFPSTGFIVPWIVAEYHGLN